MTSLDSLFVVPLKEFSFNDDSSLEDLSKLKKIIELNLSTLFDHLTKHKADMDTPLLTADGFPRSDIDVLQVRYSRSKINLYRNDLKKVLQLIEIKLVDKLSINNGLRGLELEPQAQKQAKTTTQENIALIKNTIPFAVVTEVVAQSPASKAGLQVNDKMIEIGDINATNHNNLQRLPGLMMNNEDKLIKVSLLRNDQIINITLTPTRNWPGQGLLGCKVNLI